MTSTGNSLSAVSVHWDDSLQQISAIPLIRFLLIKKKKKGFRVFDLTPNFRDTSPLASHRTEAKSSSKLAIEVFC